MSDWKKPVQISTAVLTLFAIATGALIAGTYLGTKDEIEIQEKRAQAKALLEIMPSHTHDNDMVEDYFLVSDTALLNLRQERRIFIARQSGEIAGFIIPSVAPDGYSGDIRLITGINRQGDIAGVRVVSHKETPGLGDKVDLKKSDWILSFNEQSLTMPAPEQWKVKKDKGHFDAFTGATITPRAVVKAVYQTLQYYEANKQQLIENATANETTQVASHGKEL